VRLVAQKLGQIVKPAVQGERQSRQTKQSVANDAISESFGSLGRRTVELWMSWEELPDRFKFRIRELLPRTKMSHYVPRNNEASRESNKKLPVHAVAVFQRWLGSRCFDRVVLRCPAGQKAGGRNVDVVRGLQENGLSSKSYIVPAKGWGRGSRHCCAREFS
jgi:hypothetical protein